MAGQIELDEAKHCLHQLSQWIEKANKIIVDQKKAETENAPNVESGKAPQQEGASSGVQLRDRTKRQLYSNKRPSSTRDLVFLCTEPNQSKLNEPSFKLSAEIRIKQEAHNSGEPVEQPMQIATMVASAKQHAVALHLKCVEPHCDWVFQEADELERHLKVAHKVLKARCMQRGCGKSFKTKRELDSHLVSHEHSHENLWMCKYRKALKPLELKDLLSTGEPVPISAKRFATHFKLRQHVRDYQYEGIFVCTKCGWMESCRGWINYHYQVKHNKMHNRL